MTDKLNLDVNLVTPDGLPFDKQFLLMQANIKRLFDQNKITSWNSFSQLKIADNEVTMALLIKRVPENSVFMFEVFPDRFPGIDTPKYYSGSQPSGRLTVYASSDSRMRTMFYQNGEMMWCRHFDSAAPVTDTGWMQMGIPGQQENINSTAASAVGFLLSNIQRSGEYYITGSVMATLTDAPTTGSCSLSVKKFSNGATFQYLRLDANSQAGWRRKLGGGSWKAEGVQDETFNSAAAMNFAGGVMSGHLSPNTNAAWNLGGASNRWNNIYLVNNPNVSSDARLKEDVEDISEELIAFVVGMPLKKYKLKSDGSIHFGIVITDDIHAKACALGATSLITKGEDGFYAVCYAEWQNILLEGLRRKL